MNQGEAATSRPTEPSDADIRSLVDAMQALCWIADADGWIFWYNRRWYEYTGTRPEDMVGWGWQSVHDPEALPAVRDLWQTSIRAGQPCEMVFSFKGADGRFRPFLTRVTPAIGPDGRIFRWFGTNTEVSLLRDSEMQLRRLLDNLFAFVGVLDLDGRLIEANAAPLEMAGLRREDVIGRLFWDTHWWSWSPDVQAELREACLRARDGEIVRYDAEARARGKDRIMVDMQIAPLRDEHGRITHLIPSGFDITERKQAEEQTRFLMRESAHRSNNLLAVIQAIAGQTAKHADTIQEFQLRFQRRLFGLAASHNVLVQQHWQGGLLGDLVRDQLAPFVEAGNPRLEIAGPHVVLRADAVQNIGLALHELATNAVKHGALSMPPGRVSVRWALIAEDNDAPLLRLVWTERDGPPVTPPTQTGFGHLVIEQMVARSLQGEVSIDFAPEGLRWELCVAAASALADPGRTGPDRSPN